LSLLQGFLTALRPDLNPRTTFTLDAIDGGSNPQGPGKAGIEAVSSNDFGFSEQDVQLVLDRIWTFSTLLVLHRESPFHSYPLALPPQMGSVDFWIWPTTCSQCPNLPRF
jgi:hypothetical protein